VPRGTVEGEALMTIARDAATAEEGEALSARERVYRYLRQQIITGQYSGGIRLVEEQIADELSVSRTPIREALQRLTSDGLVIRVRRGQLVVVNIDQKTRDELHELRIAFDEVAAKMLTAASGNLDTDALYRTLKPLADALATHGPASPEYAMAHLDFHIAINRIAFSPTTSSFLEHQAFLYRPTTTCSKAVTNRSPSTAHCSTTSEAATSNEPLQQHADTRCAVMATPPSAEATTPAKEPHMSTPPSPCSSTGRR